MATYDVSTGQVYSGVILNEYDYMYVYDGGTANETTVNNGGLMDVRPCGLANHVTVSEGGLMDVRPCGLANHVTVSEGGLMRVWSGGTALNVEWTPCIGEVYLYDGGVVTFASNYEGVYLGSSNILLSSASTMTGKELNNHSMYVMNGGTANSTTVNNDGYLRVYSGGTANSTTVNKWGSMFVYSGGVANSTTVNNGGVMRVYSGGTALNVEWTPCIGFVDVSAGAVVTFVSDYRGVYLGSSNILLSSASTMTGVTITNHIMCVMKGGTANSTTVKDGDMEVSNGGVVNSTVCSGGWIYISSGGEANFTTLSCLDGLGQMFIEGGTANSTTVNGGSLIVSNGGTVSATTVNVGDISVESGVANDTIVNSGGMMIVSPGGAANDTTVNYGGSMYVSNGGVANDTAVNYGGSIYVSNGGMANRTAVNYNAVMYVDEGGAASDTIVNSCGSMYVSNGGSANFAVVNSKGYIYVSRGGVANSTVINSKGHLKVDFGGAVSATTVNDSGYLYVSSGGTANSAVISSGGYLRLSSGGGITGLLTFAAGAFVSADEGGVIDFDISDTAAGDAARVVGLSVVEGAPDYTITVSTTQASGEYLLADSAADFGATITVNTDEGAELGTVSVGDPLVAGDRKYTLANDGALLSLTVTEKKPDSVVTCKGGIVVSSAEYVMTGKTLSGVGTEDAMHVSSGGTANETTVNSDGYLSVSSGGVANSTTVNDGGMSVYLGGVANETTVNNYGYMYVHDGGTANETTVNGNGYMYVHDGGTANETTVNDRGHLSVSSGGTANYTTVKGGSMYVSSGGTVNGTVLVYGFEKAYDEEWYHLKELDVDSCLCCILGGAVANDTVLYNGGFMVVFNGATASNTLATGEDAIIRTYFDGGIWSGAVFESTTIKNGARFYLADGVATSTAVKNAGQMYVSTGGTATAAAVSDWGTIYVLNGGSADEITVGNCGELHVGRGGTATLVRENGGCVEILNGAEVTFAENSFSGFVVSSGMMTVHSGTIANATTVENGELAVYDGGIANSAAVGNGVANFYRGAKVTGALTIMNGAVVSAYEGSVIDFDISEASAGDAAQVNNLALVQGAPDYTVTVSGRQAEGDYALADGAAGFDKTVTVVTDAGATLGTVSVGDRLVSGGYAYTLGLDSGELSLAVESAVVLMLTPGDLDGDGRADVVMSIMEAGHGAEGATGAWLIQQNQTAAWGDLSRRNAGWEIFGTGYSAAEKTTNDVYVKSADNVIGAWVTDDTGKVSGWETVGQFDADTQVLGLGDFNGDGQTDLLLRNDNGAVGCYLTDGTGWNYFQSLGDEWTVSAVGDLNGDGRDDVVLKHDAGFAGSWLTQADCTMAWADLDTLQAGFSIVGCGDFDGDGTSDVLLRNGNYYGAWLVQNGSAAAWMGLGDLGGVTVEQIADFDADGVDDLRIRTASGDLGAQLVKGADTLDWKYYGSVGPEWSTSLAAI